MAEPDPVPSGCLSSELSNAASVTVNHALNSALGKCGGDQPEEIAPAEAGPGSVDFSSSTQVESTLDDGVRIHRNPGSTEIDHPSQLDVGGAQAQPTPSMGGADGSGRLETGISPESEFAARLLGEGASLADEMAAAVAAASADGSTLALFQELYGRFSEIARSFTSEINSGGGHQQRNARSNNTDTRRPNQSAPASGGGGGQGKLPAEVKERILRTLSDIKAQLDAVKAQLMKQTGRT